jgi:hypothetical protein
MLESCKVGCGVEDRYGLEKIIDRHNVILFDSSALTNNGQGCGPNLKGDYWLLDAEEKKARFKEDRFYLQAIYKYLKEDAPFFVTRMVFSELNYREGAKYYLKKIRAMGGFKRNTVPYKTIFLLMKERQRISYLLKEKKRILDFNRNGHNFINELKETNPHILENFEISETDLDFLLSAVAITYSGKTCALLSNDKEILSVWKMITCDNPMLKSNTEFYHTRATPFFVKAV